MKTEELKIQFTSLMRETVDWLKVRKVLSEEEYKFFYEELVSKVEKMGDKEFEELLVAMSKYLLGR